MATVAHAQGTSTSTACNRCIQVAQAVNTVYARIRASRNLACNNMDEVQPWKATVLYGGGATCAILTVLSVQPVHVHIRISLWPYILYSRERTCRYFAV